jgi:hypothetical protein
MLRGPPVTLAALPAAKAAGMTQSLFRGRSHLPTGRVAHRQTGCGAPQPSARLRWCAERARGGPRQWVAPGLLTKIF